MTGTSVTKRPEGQLERINPLTCEQCGGQFQAKNRNGVAKRFCSRDCKTVWHNQERLRLYKETHRKKTAVQRPRTTSIRTLEQLSAAEGLPAGTYGAGALGRIGRRSVATIIPPSERIGLLVEAAKRLGITEGATLTAARLAARQAAPVEAA